MRISKLHCISKFLGHKEEIKNVEKIEIDEYSINLYAEKIKTKYRIRVSIPKEGWRLFVEDIEIRTSPNTLMSLKEPIGCIIDNDRKKIFCGEKTEKYLYK